MNAAAAQPRVLLYEGTGAEPLGAADRSAVVAALLDRGYRVTRSHPGAAAAAEGETFVVVGRFNEPVPEVSAAGVAVPVLDIGGRTPAQVVDLVEAERAERPLNAPGTTDAWKPWFPVIDPARCTNCMQCLTFCLFDVYGVDADQRLRVENPTNCKVNCPACSRVCPDVAIMFPKYHAGPIDGAPVNAADVGREKMKIDISALLGGDLYARLRERSADAKARFSRERSADQALAERRRCLAKLAESADIPREVLDALPTPEEIQRKAAAVAARSVGSSDGTALPRPAPAAPGTAET